MRRVFFRESTQAQDESKQDEGVENGEDCWGLTVGWLWLGFMVIVTPGSRRPANVRAFLPLRKEERNISLGRKMHRRGSRWKNQGTWALPYQGPRERAGLDKDRKTKEKGTGEGKGKRQGGWREAKETEVDKTPRFSSSQRQQTLLRVRGTVLWLSLFEVSSFLGPLAPNWIIFSVHSATGELIFYFSLKLTAFWDLSSLNTDAGNSCFYIGHLKQHQIQHRNPSELLQLSVTYEKQTIWRPPHKPPLHASGFILVFSRPYTCFCSLKQMKIVKHKETVSSPDRLWCHARCSSNTLQSKRLPIPWVLHPGLQSRPPGLRVEPRKHHFNTFPRWLTLELSPGTGFTASCHQAEQWRSLLIKPRPAHTLNDGKMQSGRN